MLKHHSFSWKTATIVMIPKQGKPKEEIGSYQPSDALDDKSVIPIK